MCFTWNSICDQDTSEERIAQGMAECMTKTGCLLVRDPLVDEADNVQFNAMMQQYFSQPTDIKMLDARPEVHYQVSTWMHTI